MEKLDHQVLDEFRKGSDQAFRKIYTFYFPTFYAYALGLVHNKEVAEEIVHDVLMILFEKRDESQTWKSIDAFLLKSTRNKCLDYLRWHKSQLERISTYGQLVVSEADEINDRLDVEYMHKFIELTVEKLPAQSKRVIIYLFFRKFSIDETAQKLGINPQSVKNSRQYALKKMKELLDSQGVSLLLIILFWHKD